MRKIFITVLITSVLASTKAADFVSSPFRLDMCVVNGKRVAKSVEIIQTSAVWADDAADAVAEVNHTPPGGDAEILHYTTSVGTESFTWDAQHTVPGDHLFTHTVRRGNMVLDTMSMTFTVPEPSLNAIRIFGPTNFYSGNSASYICMGYFSDDSGRQVIPAWSLVEPVSGITINENGVLLAEQSQSNASVTLRAVSELSGVTVTNEMAVTIEAAFLNLGQTALNVAKTAGEESITVSGSGAWTAESSVDWLTLVESSGAGDGLLAFTFAKNTETKARKGIVTVSCGIMSARLTVKQAAGDAEVRVTVTFDPQDGSVNYTTHEYLVGETYGTLPYPTLNDKVFGGWWTQPNGQGVRVIASSEVTVTVTRLYAYWREQTVADVLNSAIDWITDTDIPWVIDRTTSKDSNASMRSGAIGDEETSTIMTEVTGPGTISFWWRASSEEAFDVLLMYDGEDYVAEISGQTGWENFEYTIADSGTHLLRWVYAKDESDGDGHDCAWLDSVTWMPDFAAGEATGQSVDAHVAPTAWRTMYGLGTASLDVDSDGDGLTDWDEYVVGSNPTDPTSLFRLNISMVGNTPEVMPTPYLGSQREYVIEGKTNLTDKAWVTPTNTAHRFFRAKVKLKTR